MKVRDLLNALDTLTGGRTQNMDLDVLVRAIRDDGDDIMIASDLTLRIEETCADDTLFIDVTDEEDAAGEMLGEALRREVEADTIPSPPPRRHLEIVR